MLSNDNLRLKILVCGAGSIGLRHIKNLISLDADVSIWRSRSKLAKKLSKDLGLKVHTSLEEALSDVDGVIVATSTNKHLEIAVKAAKLEKAIFIEKPISNSLEGLNEFINLVTRKNLIVEVGCQLRAHPNLIKLNELVLKGHLGKLYTYRAVVGQRLDSWRPDTDYRKCYSADKNQGGGALLDLIHEIDLINWITGPIESVQANLSKVSDLEINVEDLVNLILVNESGAVGQVQMDMVSPDYRRKFELVFKKGVLYWDFVSGKLELKKDGKTQIVEVVLKNFDRNSLFLNHMKHFLHRIKDPKINPLCSLDDGIKAQKLAEAAKLSNTLKTVINIKDIAL
jgi:predicted dehydrogenase